jgi:hypothetical protein
MPFVPSSLILSSWLIVAAADEVPRLDIEATCRAAQPLTHEDRRPYENCMRDERGAEADLRRQWSSFSAPSKTRCAQEATIGGTPSYVELLVCLQLANDAINQGTMGGQGTTDAPAGARRPRRQP